MRPATDIALKVGHLPICLRASLRAATLLEQQHGFDKLLTKTAEGDVGTMADVVAISAESDLLDALSGVPLNSVMPSLIDAVSRHVLALAGVDTDKRKATGEGERISYADYHAKLFRIATGWLGWSPAQAWDATPGEILEAYEGHLEMLRAVHGSGEAEQSPPDKPDQAKFDRQGLQELKALAV